jgi:hypothetical protein
VGVAVGHVFVKPVPLPSLDLGVGIERDDPALTRLLAELRDEQPNRCWLHWVQPLCDGGFIWRVHSFC